jgi:hypothetical protein
MKPENRTRAIMGWSFAIVTVISLLLVMGSAFAQISIDPVNSDCPDYCDKDTSTLYQKGIFDSKLRKCVYGIQTLCKYGCKDEKVCAEFPDIPPENTTEYDDTLWRMSRWIYNKKSNEVTMSFHGTDYMPAENGTLFLQLTDSNNNPINDGYCTVDVFYPNETAPKFMENMPLSFIESGLYYLDFFVPDNSDSGNLGIYMLNAYCYYSEEYYKINLPYNIVYDGTLISGGTNDTHAVEETDCSVIDTTGGTYMYFYFNDSNIGNINLSSITSIDFIFVGAHSKDGYFQIWNFNTSSWDNFTAFTGTSITGGCFDVKSRGYSLNYNLSHYVSGDEIRFGGYMTSNGKIVVDNVFLVFHNNGSVINDIRGAGEIHVSDIPFETWILFSTLPEPALQSNHDICIDNETHIKILTWEQCIGNNCKNVSQNQTEFCPYGCYGNETYGQCNPAPFDRTLFIILFIIGMMALVIVIAVLYDRFTSRK